MSNAAKKTGNEDWTCTHKAGCVCVYCNGSWDETQLGADVQTDISSHYDRLTSTTNDGGEQYLSELKHFVL